MRGRKSVFYGVLVILALCIACWCAGLIRCEVLTYLHYDEFKEAYKQNTMLPDTMASFKVLDYSDVSARVYYLGEGHSGGDILEFELHNGIWQESHWKTVWSSSGSASGIVWPYWWHFIYGGF